MKHLTSKVVLRVYMGCIFTDARRHSRMYQHVQRCQEIVSYQDIEKFSRTLIRRAIAIRSQVPLPQCRVHVSQFRICMCPSVYNVNITLSASYRARQPKIYGRAMLAQFVSRIYIGWNIIRKIKCHSSVISWDASFRLWRWIDGSSYFSGTYPL